MNLLKSKYPISLRDKASYNFKFCFTGFFLALISFTPSHAVTLNDVIQSAMSSHPSLKKEALNVERANFGIDVAKSAYKPKVNLRVLHSEAYRRSTLPNLPTIEDTISPQSAGLSLEYRIYDGGRRAADKNISKIELAKSYRRQEKIKTDIIVELINAFYDYVEAEKVLALTEENHEFAYKQYDFSKKRYEIGVIPETDVLISESNYLELKADLLKAKSDRLRMKEILALLSGTSITTSPMTQPLTQSFKTRNEIKSCMTKKSISLDLTQYDFQIAEQREKRAKYAWRPTVDFNISATSNRSPSAAIDQDDDLRATLSLSMPLYSGGENKSKRRQAAVEKSLSLLDIQIEKRDLDRRIENIWRTLEKARTDTEIDTSRVELNKAALSNMDKSWKLGRASISEFLLTSRTLNSAKRSYAISENRLKRTEAEIAALCNYFDQ